MESRQQSKCLAAICGSISNTAKCYTSHWRRYINMGRPSTPCHRHTRTCSPLYLSFRLPCPRSKRARIPLCISSLVVLLQVGWGFLSLATVSASEAPHPSSNSWCHPCMRSRTHWYSSDLLQIRNRTTRTARICNTPARTPSGRYSLVWALELAHSRRRRHAWRTQYHRCIAMSKARCLPMRTKVGASVQAKSRPTSCRCWGVRWEWEVRANDLLRVIYRRWTFHCTPRTLYL